MELTSSFTWLDYSDHERRKAMEVVDLFREEDTRDELGLGVVRDAFADLFFPGTTTIQTRARYFLFVPWVYQRIEERRVASREVADKARSLQDRLRQSLTEGGEERGVIGQLAGYHVQRLPSNVYWHGLQQWGILKYQGSEDEYRRQMDLFYRRGGQQPQTEKGETAELGLTNWDPYLPSPPADWQTKTTFELTTEESDYLKDRVQIRFPAALLTRVLELGIPVEDGVRFPWDHAVIQTVDATLREQVGHAELFSIVMHGAALLYNLMLSEESQREDGRQFYRDQLDLWWGTAQSQADALHAGDLTQLWDHLSRLRAPVKWPTRHFVESWVDLARKARSARDLADSPAARALIAARERQLKGGRARIGNLNALRLWNGASGSAQLDYRWNRPVRDIVNDILKAQGKTVKDA